MKKVTIIGCFAESHDLYDGQTIKTRTIWNELIEYFGESEIEIIDTFNWSQNTFKILYKCVKSVIFSENIIMLPAKNGLIILAPLLSILKKIFNRKVHYVVIGGWLFEYLTVKKYLVWFLKGFEGIYVETQKMKEDLHLIGFENIFVMPNFKKITKANLEMRTSVKKRDFKFCTFSRVMKEKGINTAINLVSNLNKKGTKCELDIYGKVNESYEKEFQELIKINCSFVKYKGIVNPNESVKILKEYDGMLFLTEYEGEGFPGTLIDALFAGLPVIATNWKYNSEIIINGKTGYLYEVSNYEELESISREMIGNISKINEMRSYCLKYADNFMGDKVIRCLLERM